MSSFSKRFVGLLAAAAATISAAPASAHDHDQHWHHDHHDHHDGVGGAVAAVAVLGGLAAVAAASKHDEKSNYGSRDAIEQCTDAAERRASALGDARVTQITSVDEIKRGYRVGGLIRVRSTEDSGDDDYRSRGSFMCETRRGDIRHLDFRGLGGW